MFLMLMAQGLNIFRPRFVGLNNFVPYDIDILFEQGSYVQLEFVSLSAPRNNPFVYPGIVESCSHYWSKIAARYASPYSNRIALKNNTDRTRKRSFIFRLLLSLIPVIFYLLLLSLVPLPDALASSDITTTALSRLVVLGTTILGLLSGFGAISNAWVFLPLFSLNRYRSFLDDKIMSFNNVAC